MPDYQKGKVYKISCNITGLTYYGSTTQPLSVRMGGHKRMMNCSSKQIIMGGNYDYSLVEDCPCENKEQLHRRERFYIENNECVNKKIPCRTSKEHYEQNKDKVLAHQKEYHEENKDKISKQNKIKVTCECGAVVNKSSLARHCKTKKHRNYLESQK